MHMPGRFQVSLLLLLQITLRVNSLKARCRELAVALIACEVNLEPTHTSSLTAAAAAAADHPACEQSEGSPP